MRALVLGLHYAVNPPYYQGSHQVYAIASPPPNMARVHLLHLNVTMQGAMHTDSESLSPYHQYT